MSKHEHHVVEEPLLRVKLLLQGDLHVANLSTKHEEKRDGYITKCKVQPLVQLDPAN